MDSKPRRVIIYNLSSETKNIKFPDRDINIGSGQYAWVPKPKKNIFAETSNGTLYIPLSADYVYITNNSVGTNLTMKDGYIENTSDITVVATNNDFTYTLTPHKNTKTILAVGSIWTIKNPLIRRNLGSVKIKEGDGKIVYNGEEVYSK
ncbi:MAG TPA: hypothetical protein PKD85_01435 [Saprospiraceae bacterium]|nr:hypothetical protein [Saprospiraceae bacterium]